MATPIPQNHAEFELDELCSLFAVARLPHWPRNLTLRGVATDSRSELAGKLFVALSGERFDGHDHVASAVARGAAAVLVERSVGVQVPEFVVRSTLTALGELGLAFRKRRGLPIIGIGGAAGKTTTRALTEAFLRHTHGAGVLATPGNLNNRIGVPMVLLAEQPSHVVGVLELGTNQPGEIRALTDVVRPDVALLTLIALEHTEGLIDLDGVEREEADLFSAHPKVAIGNGDDERARRVVAAARAERKLLYGFAEDCAYRVLSLSQRGATSTLEAATPYGPFSFTSSWLPKTVAWATLGALAAADSISSGPVPREAVVAAIQAGSWQQPGRFLVRSLLDGTVLVDDSYNSNPASLRAAISSTRELAEARGSAFHLVLGEMRELGFLSSAEHASIGAELTSLGAASLTAIAGDARLFLDDAAARSGCDAFFAEASSAVAHVLRLVRPGDVILVKGSRGVGSEVIVNALASSRGVVEPA
jgi:UDP-N-acetylmuramoyl-tripeptide--D-alanyl-D-alanine ligase